MLNQRENREFGSELKFLVSVPVAEQIRQWARTRLGPDPNGHGELNDAYEISSIYFDTERFDVFHRQGSFGRSKYRIRRYGDESVTFLERKLKTRGLVSKRRTAVRQEDLSRLATEELQTDWCGFWYQRRLAVRGLRPVCQISYFRTARVSSTNYGPIRLTIDRDLRARADSALSFNGTARVGLLLLRDQAIVEFKYRVQMPVLFKLLIEEFALQPQALSKYRLAAKALGLVSPGVAAQSPSPSLQKLPCLTF